MNNLIIRKAKEQDLKAIQELNHELFLLEKRYDSLLSMNWSFEKVGENYFKTRISEQGGVCFVAEVNSKIVGYLAGGMIKPLSYRTIKYVSELENTLVKENFREQGIGEKLFKEFVKWSKSQGAERIKVLASFDNVRGVNFYRKVGFVPFTTELEYELK